MTAGELREKYLNFFIQKGHKVIPSAPLVPENDPSVLFTTAGMHPLVPNLLGQPHPEGKRLADVQKCVRTNDIDEVGDLCHHTFFEMLGNWSLGDYWKEEAITWTFEFLTEELKINPENLSVTCFGGDQDAPKDTESEEAWKSLGIPQDRIFLNGKEDNWWSLPEGLGPQGPDSEIFFDLTGKSCGNKCRPGCGCGRFTELGNNVFMEFNKTADGNFEKLKQRNVDFGGGFERILAVANGFDDDFFTDLWKPTIQEIEKLTGLEYGKNSRPFRIIADHLRASVFIVADGIEPSNKERGYVLRRLIRRATLQLKQLGTNELNPAVDTVAKTFISIMSATYPALTDKEDFILQTLTQEVNKFNQTLGKGLKEFQKLTNITGKIAFDLFQTYGFPVELTVELATEKGMQFDLDEFKKEFEKHKEFSRTASAGMFKGGLGDQSEIATKYHTATHLLHAALRQVLGNHVQQKGSNITAERLRFDFSQPEKVTEGQLKEIEELVNQKIKEGLPITSEVMDKKEALKSGALGFFTEKYGDKVTVYTIGNPSTSSGRSGPPFSREICGGPHVKSTGELGTFTITKEESAGAGLRRIYAVLS